MFLQKGCFLWNYWRRDSKHGNNLLDIRCDNAENWWIDQHVPRSCCPIHLSHFVTKLKIHHLYPLINSADVSKCERPYEWINYWLLARYFSFASYKVGLIKTLTEYRACKINKTWSGFLEDITEHIDIIKDNIFLAHTARIIAYNSRCSLDHTNQWIFILTGI